MRGTNILRELRGSWASDQLDMIRGGAAIAVLLLHLRDLFFIDYADLASPSIVTTAFYVMGNFGHQAVVLFFVLSGYFISSTVMRSVVSDRWSWRRYLIQRVARLGVVLVPALVLTACLDRTGIAMFGLGHNYVGDGTVYILAPGILDRLGVRVFAGNLFFLQTIFITTFGSNSPLWSLSYEFWFYVFFPIAVLCIRPGRRWPNVLLIPIIVILVVARHGLAFYFVIWLLGYAVGALPRLAPFRRNSSAKLAALAGTVASAVVLALVWRNRIPNALIADVALATTFSVVLYSLLQVEQPSANGPVARFGRVLAGFSYTLYAVHLPILFFLRAWLIPDGRWTPTAAHLAFAAVIVLAVLSTAYGVSRFTEAKTGFVRAALGRALRVEERAGAG